MPGRFGFEDEEREAGERPWYDRDDRSASGSAGGAGGWPGGADSGGEQPFSGQTSRPGYGEREPASGGIAPAAPQSFGKPYEQPAHPMLPPQSDYPTPSLYGQPEPTSRPVGPTSRPLGSTSRPLGSTSRPLSPGEPSWGGYGQPAQPTQPAQPSGWGQFEQPGQPAQPSGGYYGQPEPASGWGGTGGYGGYGQAAAPSQGWGPPSGPGTAGAYGSGSEWGAGPTTNGGYGTYGTAGPSSQGWSGREVARYVPGGYAPDRYVPGGYGPPSRYGGYGEYGMYSGYGAYGGYIEGTAQEWISPAEARRSSRRRLLVTLGVVTALLLVALAGAGYAVFNVFTPQAAVDNFCGDLRGGHYADAYTLLEGTAQSQVTVTGFAQAQTTLARAAGGIVQCGVNSAATTYQYHPGDTAATLNVAIEWASAGRLTGWAHLKNDGGWKIAALDSSVFGVNLGALSTVTTYCQALIDQDYTAVYELLSSRQRAQVKGPDYAQLGQWQDAIDGPVQVCQVVHVGTAAGSGNSDELAHLPVTMTRTKLGQRQDDVALAAESGGWKVTSIGPQLQGTDVGGLAVGVHFCSDLASGNYADAYSLISTGEYTGDASSEIAFADAFNGTTGGIKLANCTSDTSTYKVSGVTATLDTEWLVERLSDGATGHGTVTESMSKLGDSWKVTGASPKQ